MKFAVFLLERVSAEVALVALRVDFLSDAENDFAVDRLLTDVARPLRAVLVDMRFASEMAAHTYVLGEFGLTEVALEAVGMIELVVDRDARLDDVFGTRGAALTEEVEIIVLTINDGVSLEDVAFCSERHAAVAARETKRVEHFGLNAYDIVVLHRQMAVIALLTGDGEVVLFAVRLLLALIVFAVVEGFGASGAYEVLGMIVGVECLYDTSAADLLLTVPTRVTELVDEVVCAVEDVVFVVKLLLMKRHSARRAAEVFLVELERSDADELSRGDRATARVTDVGWRSRGRRSRHGSSCYSGHDGHVLVIMESPFAASGMSDCAQRQTTR